MSKSSRNGRWGFGETAVENIGLDELDFRLASSRSCRKINKSVRYLVHSLQDAHSGVTMKYRKTRPVDKPSNEGLRRLYGNRLRNALLSAFIILNIGTVLFMNIPPDSREVFNRTIDERLPGNIAYSLHYCGWRIGQYAHLVGLDNRWTMFAHNSRFNWWYGVKAQYADSTVVDLPLFGQGLRTFWQRNLFDFREAKLSLNLYPNILDRKSYSYYLRRQYPTHSNAAITSIIWELHHQNILDPIDAGLHGYHLEPSITTQLLNEFDYTPQGDLR